MSVLIKGMEIPKNCFTDDCPCLNGESGYCQADKEHRYVYGDRPCWCPLGPVPPHGDLIERDKIAFEDDYYGWRDKQVIKAAPTIIEAEEGDYS